MDGVFMFKLIRNAVFIFALFAAFWCGALLAQKGILREEVIRLHVVGASNSEEDQSIKLQVRDAINTYLQGAMDPSMDITQAKAFLQAHLPQIEQIANEALHQLGSMDTAKVSLAMERFPARIYDTFKLPSGVYEALRVTIGEGQGRNWWCVVFPSLCVPATSADFEAAAVAAGLPKDMAQSLTGEYELRFYLLDCIGKVENFLWEFRIAPYYLD